MWFRREHMEQKTNNTNDENSEQNFKHKLKNYIAREKKQLIFSATVLLFIIISIPTGIFKILFSESDTSSCRALLKTMDDIEQIEYVDTKECGRGRSILRYNVTDSENEKMGVYCLSSTFQTVSLPKFYGKVTCNNYERSFNEASNMAEGNISSDNYMRFLANAMVEDDGYFKSDEQIATEKEIMKEVEKNPLLYVTPMILPCHNEYVIYYKDGFLGNDYIGFWQPQTKEIDSYPLQILSFFYGVSVTEGKCPSPEQIAKIKDSKNHKLIPDNDTKEKLSDAELCMKAILKEGEELKMKQVKNDPISFETCPDGAKLAYSQNVKDEFSDGFYCAILNENGKRVAYVEDSGTARASCCVWELTCEYYRYGIKDAYGRQIRKGYTEQDLL